MIITIDGKPDGSGRVAFTARWHDGQRERGQCFRTNLTDWLAHQRGLHPKHRISIRKERET